MSKLSNTESRSEDCVANASLDLKRELISLQTQAEVSSLDSPKALCAIGPPFRSDHGMESVAPQETPYPILRYVFANHARTFPFLERVDEKEFWQDGVQVFLETFTERHISSMIDRREETKRHKMSRKLEKVLDLMMVSGIKTTSGLEERVQGPNVEFGVHCATDQGLVVNSPDVRVNEWEVNIVAVRTVATKKLMRTHQHSVSGFSFLFLSASHSYCSMLNYQMSAIHHQSHARVIDMLCRAPIL